MTDSRKIIVLGMDGATFDVILPLARAGRLPAFTRMMESGAWGPLESVANQRSAAAWTTFQTGTNPGKHGIYEFYDYLPETYNLRFINGAARQGETLWSILGRQGHTVGVLNVPMTHPAEAVNGYLVAGLDCPSPRSRGFCHPPELLDELERRFGEYMIEPGLTGAMIGGRIDDAVELVQRELRQKTNVVRYLREEHPADFCMAVFRSLDAVQHTFWKYRDAEHPEYDKPESTPYRGVIDDTYVRIDAFLGELLDSVDTDTSVIVMSDHGFGAKHPATAQINAWLESNGYLARRPKPGPTKRWLGTLYRFLVGRTSRRTKEWLWERFPRLRDQVQSRLCFADIDWARTQAYSDSLFANVRINLRGREHGGIVSPGDDCERLVARLIEDLGALRDRQTGEPIVDRVFRREELYSGPYVEKAPEILIRWREDCRIHGIQIDSDADGKTTPAVPSEDERFVTGDHRLHGVFLAMGPDILRGKELAGATIADLAPTILYQMRHAVPRDMDGNVLTDIFRPESVQNRPVVYHDASADPAATDPSGYDADEEEKIRARLRDLGYVE